MRSCECRTLGQLGNGRMNTVEGERGRTVHRLGVRLGNAVVIEKAQVIRCIFIQANAAETGLLDRRDGHPIDVKNSKFSRQGVCGTPQQRGTGKTGRCLAGAEAEAPNLDGDEGDAFMETQIILQQLDDELESAIQQGRMKV